MHALSARWAMNQSILKRLFAACNPHRAVAAAIDAGNSKFFKDAGINGYEFVDKIVQMPFGVPLRTKSEKQKLIQEWILAPEN